MCSGNSLDGTTLQQAVSDGEIPSTDYEEAGLIVETGKTVAITGYSIEGGPDVVIPSNINGKKVVAIYNNAFTKDGVEPTGISTNKIEYNIQPLYNKKDNYEVVPLGTASDGLGITSVIIPNTVKIIGEGAFRHNNLTSVTIPNSVTSIDGAFQYNQLTNVTIPGSVTSIGGYAFNNNQLTSVEIGNGVTSIGKYAFKSNQLTSITIPSSVTSIGEFAFYENQLTSVVIPSSVTSIGNRAFNNNQLPDEDAFIYKRNSDGSIDNTTIIGYGGKNKSPIIPNTVTSIGDNAFSGNKLTSVEIGNGVTSIGASAFSINQLTSVTIPSSVTSIGSSAFYKNDSYNPNLTKIINKTGKSFDWGHIVNWKSGYKFVTGTVVNSNGNVEVVNN